MLYNKTFIFIMSLENKDLSNIELVVDDNKESILGSSEYIANDLSNRLKMYEVRSYNHKKHEKYHNNIWRGLGYPQVVLGIVISVIFGSSGFSEPFDKLAIIGFAFGFTQTILAATLVFFNIQEKSNKHHNTSSQLSDLHKDLRVFLLYKHDFEELEEMETLMLEKEKFIDSYAPNLSGIIGVVKEKPK